MRHWETDGRVEADTRYCKLTRWLFRHGLVPDWVARLLLRRMSRG